MDRRIGDSNALALEERGLSSSDFRQIAKNGFSDRYNAYPHSMAWFRDHLYLGASRNNFVMIKVTIDDGVRNCGKDQAQVLLVAIDGRGHEWPGGRRMAKESYSGKMSRKISGNDMMWSFFERYTSKK